MGEGQLAPIQTTTIPRGLPCPRRTPTAEPAERLGDGLGDFAVFLLMLGGVWGVIVGIAGIAEDDFFVVTPDWVLQLDVTVWGWIHLIAGIVLFLSGVGIFSGNVLARTVGVIVAVRQRDRQLRYGCPDYPVWWIIASSSLDVAIIWALTADGRRTWPAR